MTRSKREQAPTVRAQQLAAICATEGWNGHECEEAARLLVLMAILLETHEASRIRREKAKERKR